MFRVKLRIDAELLRRQRREGADRPAGHRLCAAQPGHGLAGLAGARPEAAPVRRWRCAPEVVAAPVAEIEGLRHRYGKVAALDGVTLRIPAGRVVGLIGPDGVGKSTLLALVAGARRMQDGRVEVLGGDMADARHRAARLPAHRLHAAGARAGTSIPTSACARTSTSSRRLFGQGRAERDARIAELLAATGLAPFADRPARQALGRHEAEARPVLRADPRPGPADPRRADHRRRSALAPAVLGAGRRGCARAGRA